MINLFTTYVVSHIKAAQKNDDEGATMVEYGIMVAAIAVVVGAAAFALGGEITTLFEDLLPLA